MSEIDSTVEWAYNDQTKMAFTTERTAHILKETDGHTVTTQCGRELSIDPRIHNMLGEQEPAHHHCCGNCNWEEVIDLEDS